MERGTHTDIESFYTFGSKISQDIKSIESYTYQEFFLRKCNGKHKWVRQSHIPWYKFQSGSQRHFCKDIFLSL